MKKDKLEQFRDWVETDGGQHVGGFILLVVIIFGTGLA